MLLWRFPVVVILNEQLTTSSLRGAGEAPTRQSILTSQINLRIFIPHSFKQPLPTDGLLRIRSQ